MKCHYRVSFEPTDGSQPVVTVCGAIEANGGASALRSAVREAIRQWPTGRSFGSWVLVVERLRSPDTAGRPDTGQAVLGEEASQ
jgi:hypothetical protein